MRNPFGNISKVSRVAKNWRFCCSAECFSQEAISEEQKSQRRTIRFKRHQPTLDAEAMVAISDHPFNRYETRAFLYLLDPSVAKKFASLVKNHRDPDSTAYTMEINSGPGFVTRELLHAGVRSITMFETVPHFWPALTTLTEQYPDRLILDKSSFYQMIRLHYWNGKEISTTELHMSNVKKRSWREKPAVEIIGSLGNASLLHSLMSSIIFQNGLCRYGRIIVYVAIPPSVFLQASCNNEHYTLYRCWTVMFKTFFRYDVLGRLPRSAFYPKCSSSVTPIRSLKRIRAHDADSMYVLKIEAKPDIFKDDFNETDAVMFYYFLHYHLKARKNRVIPALEHWLPGCGYRLIADGYTVYTEFGELMPDELMRLFMKFKSFPDFKSSSFIPCMSSYLMKMEDQFDFDDTAENIDDMFQTTLNEYQKKMEEDNRDQ